MRVEGGGVVLRNVPVRPARGEAGLAGGATALKLVFAGEATLALSGVADAAQDADGRVSLTLAGGARVLFGRRPW
jgi:hypothetical protein